MNETSLKDFIEQKFGLLEEKDEKFKKLCIFIKASIEELNFFRAGITEISIIIEEINHFISKSDDEIEKKIFQEKLASWKKEQYDYYIEMNLVREQLDKAIKENFELVDYATLIRTVTIYDGLKKGFYKEVREGKFDYERVKKLHENQRKINELYQKVTKTEEILEQEDVLPRLAIPNEMESEYLEYLRDFLGIPKLIEEEIETKEEDTNFEFVTETITEPIPEETVNEMTFDEDVQKYGFEFISDEEESNVLKENVIIEESEIDDFSDSLEEERRKQELEEKQKILEAKIHQKIDERINVYWTYKNYIFDLRRESAYPEIYDPIIEYLDSITEENLSDLSFDLNLPPLPQEPIIEEPGVSFNILGFVSEKVKEIIKVNKKKLLITAVLALGILAKSDQREYQPIDLEVPRIEQEVEESTMEESVMEEIEMEEFQEEIELPKLTPTLDFHIGDEITLNDL